MPPRPPPRVRPAHDREGTALSIIIRYDPATLSEEVDADAALARLEEIGMLRSLAALNERAELLRLLGRFDEAWDVANEALRNTRFSGDRAELLAARVRRARLMHLRGKSDDALSELTLCVEEARTHEWHREHALALRHRGRTWLDLGEYTNASRDFGSATLLGERIGDEAEDLELSRLGSAAAAGLLDGSLSTGRPQGPVRSRRRTEEAPARVIDAARTEHGVTGVFVRPARATPPSPSSSSSD